MSKTSSTASPVVFDKCLQEYKHVCAKTIACKEYSKPKRYILKILKGFDGFVCVFLVCLWWPYAGKLLRRSYMMCVLNQCRPLGVAAGTIKAVDCWVFVGKVDDNGIQLCRGVMHKLWSDCTNPSAYIISCISILHVVCALYWMQLIALSTLDSMHLNMTCWQYVAVILLSIEDIYIERCWVYCLYLKSSIIFYCKRAIYKINVTVLSTENIANHSVLAYYHLLKCMCCRL